jgi:hypothetical protein
VIPLADAGRKEHAALAGSGLAEKLSKAPELAADLLLKL